MGHTKIPLYQYDAGAVGGSTKDAQVKVVVQCLGQDDYIKKGQPAVQAVELLNGLNHAVMFDVTSTVPVNDIAYPDTESPDEWPLPVPVNPSRDGFRRRSWVPKSTAMDHVGQCARGNSHTVEINVKVGPVVPGELIDIRSDGKFFYQVACEC